MGADLRGVPGGVGPTVGDYVQMLARNATLNPPGSGEPSSPINLAAIQVAIATAAASTSISGTVQASDPSEPVGGLSVLASDSATQETFAGITLADGSFSIPDMDPGTYTLSVQGRVVTGSPTVTLASGQAVTGVTSP